MANEDLKGGGNNALFDEEKILEHLCVLFIFLFLALSIFLFFTLFPFRFFI
jgi:preprotein translocase subunit SecG